MARLSSKTKRVAFYARLATRNIGQDLETQLVALREYTEQRGFALAGEYADVGISGVKDRRPELDRLMADARHRRFDAVLVARLDRFTRSIQHLVLALEEFAALGIDFISIDTPTPMGPLADLIGVTRKTVARSASPITNSGGSTARTGKRCNG